MERHRELAFRLPGWHSQVCTPVENREKCKKQPKKSIEKRSNRAKIPSSLCAFEAVRSLSSMEESGLAENGPEHGRRLSGVTLACSGVEAIRERFQVCDPGLEARTCTHLMY